MRLSSLILIFLLYLTTVFGSKDFYFITAPNLLITETPHHFNVHTSTDLRMRIETVHILSKIKYDGPIYVVKKGYKSIPYYVPFVGGHVGQKIQLNFLGDICLDLEKCETSKGVVGNFINKTYEIELIDKNFIIFAETDKPIYKPGEKVKMRFMPIYPTNLMREPDGVGKRWKIILKDGKYQLEEVRNQNGTRVFDTIIIENPNGVRVAQWRNVCLQSSMKLEYQLTKDPTFGVWKSTATFQGQQEIITFIVKEYVLPRFVVDVYPPDEILASDKVIEFQVCSKYSTGKKMRAQIHGSFCISSRGQKCRVFKSTLRKSECSQISLKYNSTDDFVDTRYRYINPEYQISSINVTVVENGTTSAVSKSVNGPGVMYSPYQIKFDSKSYFKPGLPYFGRVQLLRHNNKPKKNTTIMISVSGWDYRNNWGFNKNYTSDDAGLIEFVIPYIPVDDAVTLQFSGDTSKYKSPMTSPSLYQQLSNWESVDKQYIQIQPIKGTIKCPGNLSLTILTNYDISSIDIYAQILSRGQITDINEYPPVPVKCDARNDFLGHYSCLNSDTIICQSGWKGDNCREPICDGSCENGACVEPNKCICKMGWIGSSCDTCVKAPYCKNGFCIYGNDCHCYPGWQKYDCSAKGPIIHSYSNKSTSRSPVTKPSISKKYEKQTIFERIIDIPLSKNMGPDVHIVVYFITPGREVVADAIEISNGLANCSHLGGGKFAFNQESSLPKSKVILTMDPGMKNTSCAVRIGDIALSQFGKSSNVDLSYLVRKMIDLNHKITVDKRFNFNNEQLCIPVKRVKRKIGPGRFSSGFDSSKVFATSGFTTITNMRIINSRCRYWPVYYAPMENILDFSFVSNRKLGPVGMSPVFKSTEKTKLKNQIRDFFPESWVFSYFNHTVKQLKLTVPDSMTTWRADAYCMTEKGVWIAPFRTLKVIMPFFTDIYVPYSIKLGERLRLPVKLFNYANACYEIRVEINVNSKEIKVIGLKSFTLCVCADDDKTVYFNIQPKVMGKLNITVEAVSKYSKFCSSVEEKRTKIEMYDSVRRQLLVEPQGVPSETTFSELICNKNEQFGIVELFTIPSKIVAGSLRSYLTFNGDAMGQTFDNLDKLVKMPYGCGEQNMVAVVPSIYVLEYLNGLKIENPALIGRAKEYIIKGYTRQLNYMHPNGSFSAFGKTDKAGSTWLTAFVLRSFSDASKYVHIDEAMLVNAARYLQDMQSESGCFKEQGKLFSSAMAGGVKKNDSTDESLLTAYVLISLKNINLRNIKINTDKAVACVRAGLGTNPSNYRLALTAYVLALYQKSSPSTTLLMEQLLGRSVQYGRYRYWPYDRESTGNTKINAAYIETTGYAFLALQSHQSLSELLKTVYWLSNQRNGLGGYYSTQDTVVALNALAAFAETIGLSSTVHLNVSIVLNRNRTYTGLITEKDRLLSRITNLGSENISYVSIKTNGTGCVSVQLVSLYNIDKLYSARDTFKLTVKSTVPSVKQCNIRNVKACFGYLRRDKNSNMILVTIDYPSGWELPKSELRRLTEQIGTPLNRIDFQSARMELYYDAFSYRDADKENCFQFQLEEKSKISNLKPALVRIVDYYNPEIYTDTSYTIVDKECNKTDRKVVNETSKILLCPKCVDNSKESDLEFVKMICKSSFVGVVTASNKSNIKSRVLYEPLENIFYEWKLDLEPRNCSCLKTWSNLKKDFVILSERWKSLSEKLVLSNDSVMFPLATLHSAYKFDLRRQCSRANNLYAMMDRLDANFSSKIGTNDSCASCILSTHYYFNIKNITQWYCANHSLWQLNVSSEASTIKGVLKRNNSTVHVEAEFPSNFCYCDHQLRDRKKTFRIIDPNNTISKSIDTKPNNPTKLLLNSEFQVVEESVFTYNSHIKCRL